jgi:hypothetical protein
MSISEQIDLPKAAHQSKNSNDQPQQLLFYRKFLSFSQESAYFSITSLGGFIGAYWSTIFQTNGACWLLFTVALERWVQVYALPQVNLQG